MSITYSFKDNVSYGTDDINGIVACLVGAGIAPFVSKTSYSTSAFNALTAAVVGSGTSLGGCKCTRSGSAVKVAQGIIYFENGVTMQVDANGYTVTPAADTAGYIYAYFNTSLQTADILFGTALPTTGHCVKLAQISADGTLTDCRTFARSKAATFGKNTTATRKFTLQTPVLTGGKYVYAKISDVDLSKFSYAIVLKWHDNKDGTYDTAGGVFDLSKNEFVFSCDGERYDASVDVGGNHLEGYSLSDATYMTKINNELCLSYEEHYETNRCGYTVIFA